MILLEQCINKIFRIKVSHNVRGILKTKKQISGALPRNMWSKVTQLQMADNLAFTLKHLGVNKDLNFT